MIRLALVFALALTVTAQAQTYSVPRRLPIDRAVKREFREWLNRPNGYAGLIWEELYPIGWSKDGKFAFYYEPVDEECGCYFARLVIQDMRTDKVLWEFKYDQDELRDPKTDKLPPEDNVRKLWRKNARLFAEKLREHAIVAGTSLLIGPKFTSSGRVYTAKSVTEKGKNPDDEDRIDKFMLTLTSPALGTKTVYTGDHSKQEYWFTLDAGILGVIKSPFEDRVAVIGMEINRGWEGPPHTGDVRIVGADLARGFARK
jgi:hypothetical protein